MNGLLLTVVLVFAGLSLTAATTFALGDTRVLTTPPEAVVDNFVEHLFSSRGDVARNELGARLQAKTAASELRRLSRRLQKKIGAHPTINTEIPSATPADEVRVPVKITADGREYAATLPLRREKGVWKISDVRELQRLAGGAADHGHQSD